jgi:hypothetical protein
VTLAVRLQPEDVARIDELREPKMSRSAFARETLRRAGPLQDKPTWDEAVRMLAISARSGHVAAQVALVRELRALAGKEGEVDDAISALLAQKP